MAIVIGSVIMLGGVTLQVCAANVGTVIGSRVIGEFFPAWLQLANSPHTPVGFGLSFAMNAAPLLVTELAYPTQVCIPALDLLRFSDFNIPPLQRGKITSVYNAAWYTGSIISELTHPHQVNTLITGWPYVQLPGSVSAHTKGPEPPFGLGGFLR